MLETTLSAALAWLLLAAQSHRFRRDAGVNPRMAPALRVAAALAFLLAFGRAENALAGERWVRTLTAASTSGAAVVLLMSYAPAAALRPVRLVLSILTRASRGRNGGP